MGYNGVRKHSETVGFDLPGGLGVLVEEDKKKRAYRRSKKIVRTPPVEKKVPHVDDRHGEDWPRMAGSGGRWTGWLTYREYNVIDFCNRFELSEVETLGQYMKHASFYTSERMFYTLRNVGILEGSMEQFRVSPMAKILFDMTDQFILEMDLSDEDEDSA